MNGRFDFLVLHLLSKEKMYGFQIIKKLFDATDGEIEMKTGTLYPLLQTLENNGYIAASLVLINGRDRNVKLPKRGGYTFPNKRSGGSDTGPLPTKYLNFDVTCFEFSIVV